jgi:membrane protein DedA with SNARE-associated domain
MLDLSNIIWLNWLTNHFVSLGEQHRYLNLFLGTFLEACGLPFASLPAFTSTAYLIGEGKLNFYSAILIGAFGNTMGSTVSYFLGYRFGNHIRKKRKDHKLTQKEDRLEEYIKKYGVKIIFWGQLFGFTRTFISFPAGLLKMDFKRFFVATFFGGALFVIYFSMGALYVRHLYDRFVYPYIGLSFISLGILIGLGYILTHLSFHYGKRVHSRFKNFFDENNEH